jgi:hypothetical protein
MDEQDDIFGFTDSDESVDVASSSSTSMDAASSVETSPSPQSTSSSSPQDNMDDANTQPMDIPEGCISTPSHKSKPTVGVDMPHQVTPPSSSIPSPANSLKVKEKRQIISFGDSLEERTAVKIVSSQLSAISKSVKFISQPSPIMILGQLELLGDYMQCVADQPEELDLEISHAQALDAAKKYLKRNNSQPLAASNISPPPTTNAMRDSKIVFSPPQKREGVKGGGEENTGLVGRSH